MAENYRDQQLLELAKKSLKPGPGGALGNDASGRPDFDKGELPPNTRRPSFKKGGKITKRYDGGGRVSDSVDTGTVNARTNEKSIAQGEKDFGRGYSSVRDKTGTRSGEPTVGPLIQVYPTPKGEKMYERERPMPEAMHGRDLQKYPEAMPGRSRGEPMPEAMPGRARTEPPIPEARQGSPMSKYIDRMVEQRNSKDPLTRSVTEATSGLGYHPNPRVPTFEMVPKNNTSLEAVNRANRHEQAEHERRMEDIGPYPRYAKGGMVKHGSSTRVSCRNK
jgi:hypothetical protein